MQGLYHKFAAIWSGHVRFLPHCFFSQKTGLMEPARLLTQFPSSKEEADCVPTCEGERWSSPALRRMLRIRAAWSKTHRNPPKRTRLPTPLAAATTPQWDAGHQPNQAWEAQSGGRWFKCQCALGTGSPCSLFEPHQMQPPGQEGCSSRWLLCACRGAGSCVPKPPWVML